MDVRHIESIYIYMIYNFSCLFEMLLIIELLIPKFIEKNEDRAKCCKFYIDILSR